MSENHNFRKKCLLLNKSFKVNPLPHRYLIHTLTTVSAGGPEVLKAEHGQNIAVHL